MSALAARAGLGRLPVLLLLALGLAMLIALPMWLEKRPFELRLLTMIFLYATMGHGWNILGGYAGQTSIGHGVFFGLGAYTSTLVVLHLGISPWFGSVAAMAVAALAGLAIGWPCFRLKGHFFVIATIVVAESVYLLFTEWRFVGAAIGLSLPIEDETLANFQFGRDKTPYYFIALTMLVIVTAGIALMERSRFGIVLKAIRDDEDAATSLGFSVLGFKLAAIAASAAIIGFCGTFYAQYVLFVDPPSVLGLHLSVMIALIPIVGGIGTVAGPIVGAAFLMIVSEYTRVHFSGSGRNLDLLIYGALIMAVAAFRPKGIVSLFNFSRRSR